MRRTPVHFPEFRVTYNALVIVHTRRGTDDATARFGTPSFD